MKNDMINLVGLRKIYDLILAWLDPEDPQVYCNFDIDGDKVLLSFTGRTYGVLDFKAMHDIEEQFLQGCPLVEGDNKNFVYHIGNTDYKFDYCNIDLIQFATEDGFVVDLDKRVVTADDLIDFIRDNSEFTIRANEDGEVIIS